MKNGCKSQTLHVILDNDYRWLVFSHQSKKWGCYSIYILLSFKNKK